MRSTCRRQALRLKIGDRVVALEKIKWSLVGSRQLRELFMAKKGGQFVHVQKLQDLVPSQRSCTAAGLGFFPRTMFAHVGVQVNLVGLDGSQNGFAIGFFVEDAARFS